MSVRRVKPYNIKTPTGLGLISDPFKVKHDWFTRLQKRSPGGRL